MNMILEVNRQADRSELTALYQEQGFLHVPNLFSRHEAERIRDHFMDQVQSPVEGRFDVQPEPDHSDPLKRYPRMMQMHFWDSLAMDFMLDDRIRDWTTELMGMEPLAVQTMFYFKPAGARGQALHQDNYYLRVKPGTCIAAWMALDPCDEENGGMMVVPGTHDLPMLCTKDSNLQESFTEIEVPLSETMQPVIPRMEPGDVLFFNGSVIHGSGPNVSQDRFRRAIIGHYIAGNTEQVSHWYRPVYRFDRTQVEIEPSPTGGPCGIWTENGLQSVESETGALPRHG
jgi:ectoine hydroxylase-related dioxygenase (phytanoyl-CoA dioxygenase family)